MPGPEPHTRRQRAVRRAALAVAAAGLLVGGATGAGAQLLPTTTEPAEEPTTTEAPAETTTTEAPATTTTVERTTTTAARATTTTEADEDDDVTVGDDEVVDEAEDGQEEDVPATSSTVRDVLVPGDGSEGAQSTTTTSTTVAEVAADGGIDEEAQIWLIVAGLVAVALLIGVWTVRYWIRTRPTPPDAAGG